MIQWLIQPLWPKIVLVENHGSGTEQKEMTFKKDRGLQGWESEERQCGQEGTKHCVHV